MEIENFIFNDSNNWVNLDNGCGYFGLTQNVAEELKDIACVEFPDIGTVFEKGDVCGSIETKDGLYDINAPLTCEVEKINEDLDIEPDLINKSPYVDGWLMRVKILQRDQLDEFMSFEDYQTSLK